MAEQIDCVGLSSARHVARNPIRYAGSELSDFSRIRRLKVLERGIGFRCRRIGFRCRGGDRDGSGGGRRR